VGYNFVADSTDVSSFVTFSCSRCCSQRWILVPIESTCAISYSTSIYVSLTVFKILTHPTLVWVHAWWRTWQNFWMKLIPRTVALAGPLIWSD